jgi:hypothetical protein
MLRCTTARGGCCRSCTDSAHVQRILQWYADTAAQQHQPVSAPDRMGTVIASAERVCGTQELFV